MLGISKKVEYGIFLMIYLGKNRSRYFSITDISQNLKISTSFLSNIANQLHKHKFIVSKKGLTGGYKLTSSLTQTSLVDIIQALEEPIRLVDCQRGDKCGMVDICKLSPIWKILDNKVTRLFNGVKLSDFAKKQKF